MPHENDRSARDDGTLHAAQAAAHWLATLSDENVTDAERQQFFAWLRSSTRNVDEFLRLSALARHAARRELWPDQSIQSLIEAARADNVATLDPRRAAERARPSRRAPWAIAASVALVLGLGAVLMNGQVADFLRPGYTTSIGEQRSIALEDGSVVELNSQSRLRTHFTPALRAVELTQGEAIFRVAKDAHRPFRVRAGATDIVAVGTAFNVNSSDARTIVTVLEGRVRVNRRAAPADPAAKYAFDDLELAMGEQLIVARAQPVVRLALQDTDKVTSWTERRLIFEDTPISEAAAEFARYSPRRIHIEDARLGARRISGVFDATDPASLVEFLRSDDALQVIESGNGWVVRGKPLEAAARTQ